MKLYLKRTIIVFQTFIYGYALLLLEKSYRVFIFGLYDEKFGAWGSYSFGQFLLVVFATFSTILGVAGFVPFAAEIRNSSYRELSSLIAIVQFRVFVTRIVSYCAIPFLDPRMEWYWYSAWMSLWWPLSGILTATFTALALSSFKKEGRRDKFYAEARELLRCIAAMLAISMILFNYFIPTERAVLIKTHSSFSEKLINPLFWVI